MVSCLISVSFLILHISLAEYIRGWIPDLVRLVELWEEQSLTELDKFYRTLLTDDAFSEKIDALLRFLYDIQSYEMVKYFLEINVEHYKKAKLVSSTMTGFHESCIYGFSQVCLLYIRNRQDINETFSLFYENLKTNKKEIIRNLTALQLVCLWSKYFPKRLPSYAHTVRILLNNGARVNMISTELTTPLHWTCRAKHTIQLAQDLIERGAGINARDKLNIQPIHYACWSRNQTLVEILLSKNAQLTDQDDLGRTPIHFVCMPTYIETINADDQEHQYELLKYILTKYSIDLTKQDNQGHTLLAYSCVSQNLLLMKLLLEHQPDLLNKTTNNGQTPLMICISEGFLNGIEYLLTQTGLKRNVHDTSGNTAIHHVCMCTNKSIRLNMFQLITDDNHGIFDLEKRNEQLLDPFMLCTINQSIDLCRLLINKHVILTKQDSYSRQSLHLACQIGNYELVSLLLNCSSININVVDNYNRNCLFYAISCGNEKLVDLLIENNINIKIRDVVGDTPLHLAVQHQTNAYELTNCLLKKSDGKDLINIPAADGMKPILLAANCKQAEVIHLLLKNGADVKAVDNEQHTALHLACKNNCMKSVFNLIEFGGLNVNELDCYRQTPIFYAYASNDYELVQYLISCGAEINLRDSQNYLPIHIGILVSHNEENYNLNLIDLYKDNHRSLLDDQNNECEMSPLILACMQGKLDIVKHLILNYNVNIMSTCSNGHTALHYACLVKSSKSLELIEFLMEHGCTYENVDKPKGSFLFTIIQHGDREAVMFFIDYWLVSFFLFLFD
jgi:ankyrin repeat protein